MEHDIEKIIRRKVMEAEGHAVVWKKDETWSRLEQALPTKDRKVTWYLVAASTTGVLVLLACLYQKHLNEGIYDQLTRLEADYRYALSEKSNIPSADVIEESCEQRKTNIVGKALMPRPANEVASNTETTETISDSLQSHDVPETIITDVQSVSEELPSVYEPETIQPIVGIIDAGEESPSRDRRRNKLKVMTSSSELVYTKKEDSHNNILARIK